MRIYAKAPVGAAQAPGVVVIMHGPGLDAFVEETGLGRGYVSELERGLVIPTIGTLARVAKALDVTVADLVVGESDRERLFVELRRADPKLLRELRDWLAKRLG